MIARIWRGTTLESRADEYFDYIAATGLADYRAAEGNSGVFALRRRDGAHAEFLLLTLWETFEAIRRFAGPEPEKARYYPRDAEYLLRLEPWVAHYDLVWRSPEQAARDSAAEARGRAGLPELPLDHVRHL